MRKKIKAILFPIIITRDFAVITLCNPIRRSAANPGIRTNNSEHQFLLDSWKTTSQIFMLHLQILGTLVPTVTRTLIYVQVKYCFCRRKMTNSFLT